MANRLDGADCRRWAIKLATQANDSRISGDERERLLKMRTALLELALTQDWLEGRAQDFKKTG
jgi:hypothetical protein